MRKNGFTLIELLVFIAIIGILMTILIPVVSVMSLKVMSWVLLYLLIPTVLILGFWFLNFRFKWITRKNSTAFLRKNDMLDYDISNFVFIFIVMFAIWPLCIVGGSLVWLCVTMYRKFIKNKSFLPDE